MQECPTEFPSLNQFKNGLLLLDKAQQLNFGGKLMQIPKKKN